MNYRHRSSPELVENNTIRNVIIVLEGRKTARFKTLYLPTLPKKYGWAQ